MASRVVFYISLLLPLFLGVKASCAQNLGTGVEVKGQGFNFLGQPIVVLGDSISQAWMELGEDFNTDSYLENLKLRGVNAVMIWAYIGIENQLQDPRIGYNAPRRWPWVETSGRFSPPYKFEFVDDALFSKFNEKYFLDLQDFLRAAQARNIIVLISVHDGWTKTRFAGHPFNRSNSGPLSDRYGYVELADYSNELPNRLDPLWDSKQKHQYYLERFSEKLILSTNTFNNVIFEILNEGEWYDRAKFYRFQEHFLKFFRKRTTAPIVLNLSDTNFLKRVLPDAITSHSPKWSSRTSAKEFFNFYSKRFYNSKLSGFPILFNEPVPEYRGDKHMLKPLMRMLWGTLLGGAGFFVPNDSSWKFNPDKPDPVFKLASNAAALCRQIGVNSSGMLPNAAISSTGVGTKVGPDSYLVYSQGSDKVRLKVDNSILRVDVRFFNPEKGTFYSSDTIVDVKEGKLTVRPPSAEDWVLWISSSTSGE